MRMLFLLFAIPGLFILSSGQAFADEIPIKLNIGAGLSEYAFHDAYDDGAAYVYGSELSVQAVAEKDVLTKYKDKVPRKFRKAAGKLNEVAVSHWAIPQSVFIHPDDSSKTAFGATWGIVPGIQTGFKYLKLGVSGGAIASYMYYRDLGLDKTVHFIRPGVRGALNLSVPMFEKILTLEVGTQHDAYAPQTFYGKHATWYVSSVYAMLHVRVPYKVKAKL